MIPERYLEYLALETIRNKYTELINSLRGKYYFNYGIDIIALEQRINKLQEEILEPYALNNTSKEE